MLLREIMNSRMNLIWTHEDYVFRTSFSLDDKEYGITVIEENIDDIKTIRVDFHFVSDKGDFIHHATNFNKNAGKILGIVGNGIIDKFKNYDIIYFTAKRNACSSNDEYQSRITMYRRLLHKLCIENSMMPVNVNIDDEQVFGLCKNTNAEKAFRDFI